MFVGSVCIHFLHLLVASKEEQTRELSVFRSSLVSTMKSFVARSPVTLIPPCSLTSHVCSLMMFRSAS